MSNPETRPGYDPTWDPNEKPKDSEPSSPWDKELQSQADRDRLAMEKMAAERENRSVSGVAGKEAYKKLLEERAEAKRAADYIAQQAFLNDVTGQSEGAEIRREKEAEAKRVKESQDDAAAIWEAAKKLDEEAALAKNLKESQETAAIIANAAKTLDAERAAEASKRASKERQEMLLADKHGELQMELMDTEEKLAALRKQPDAQQEDIDDLEDDVAHIKTEIEAIGALLETTRGTNQEMPAELLEASNREIIDSVDKGVEEAKPFTEMSDVDIVRDVDAAFDQLIQKEDFSEDEKAWFEGGDKQEWDDKKVIEQLLADKEKARKELYELTKPIEPEFVQAALEKPKTKLTWKELGMVAKHAAKWATNSEYRKSWRAYENVRTELEDERELAEMRKVPNMTPEQRLADMTLAAERRAVKRAIIRNRLRK